MRAISVELDGGKDLEINGVCTIRIFPGSSDYVESFLDLADTLGGIQNTNTAQQQAIERNPKEAYRINHERNEKVSKVLDGFFGDGVTAALFPWGATAKSGGLPGWLNLWFAVLDEIESYLNDGENAASSRLQAYRDKYEKYAGKKFR